ncbi:recombinase family protein [Herbaspirillum rubrisubalbicans]|uniref:Recombinase family protein n=2 Tax=Herbaspirillum rubrisubalbicans TaxID=80842 RepID=A0AAD0UBM8_9BURK|nr:recombinase family protein [Herbaspirillum rubrisubalbicans]AYR26927.1 recombinase family protein [Herbaspirillum rubrisubalbicans]
MIAGYARVSTEEQNLELQIQSLRARGCEIIYKDWGVSGAISSRPGLDEAIANLRAGDTLIVWRLDRLGRSLTHLTQLLEYFAKKGIGFSSVTEHMDTSSAGGRLIFHVMAALAEFERSLISERTRAGMACAKSAGKVIGRRPSLSNEQCEEALKLIKQASWSIPAVSEHFGIHPKTLARLLKNM